MTSIVNQVNYNEILNGGNIKQNSDYVVAIPTYNRVDEVVKKTLNTTKI